LEARSLGAGTTGHSTAKITLLQGTRLSTIVANHTEHVAGGYVEGNREAQAWLLAYAADHGVQMDHRDAYTYAGTQSGASAVRREFDIARRVGLPVEMTDAVELPCPIPPMPPCACPINCKSIRWTYSLRWLEGCGRQALC
jgi:hypothetical protein